MRIEESWRIEKVLRRKEEVSWEEELHVSEVLQGVEVL
jgi:hypothetical protein